MTLSPIERRRRWTRALARIQTPLALLLWLGGIAWLVALPFLHVPRTYMSESALAVDHPKMSFGNALERDMEALDEKLLNAAATGGKDLVRQIIADHLIDKTGAETFMQPFQNGTNVVAITRVPRSDGKEAMGLSVRLDIGVKGWQYSVSLALVLHQLISQQHYLSKDVVFLAADNGLSGALAFVEEYHSHLVPLHDFPRAGILHVMLNVECNQARFSSLEVQIEGANGLLPNLDLVNVLIRYGELQNVPVRLPRSQVRVPSTFSSDSRLNWLTQMLGMMARQATGQPTNLHGAFLEYRIEAATLSCRGSSTGANSRVIAGRLLEGTFKAISFIHERFHQSFFFYLLAHEHGYISIAMYLPPLGLMVAGAVVGAISLWLSSTHVEHAASEASGSSSSGARLVAFDSSLRGCGRAVAVLVVALLSSVLILLIPSSLVVGAIEAAAPFLSSWSYLVSFATFCTASGRALVPRKSTLSHGCTESSSGAQRDSAATDCQVLHAHCFERSTCRGGMSQLFFSLAMVLAIPIFLLAALAHTPGTSPKLIYRIGRLLRRVVDITAVVLTSPVALLLVVGLTACLHKQPTIFHANVATNEGELRRQSLPAPLATVFAYGWSVATSPDLHVQVLDASNVILHSAIDDWQARGLAWTWPIVCLVYVPLHATLSAIALA
ncbi:hypothetical protein CAOG_02254 [Capsaspora owczarzaki ATCC 30864]|nr:hypothetical protein CAOG_02254 [Capsaspora owczarzaki ATCC 30864]|eukprot:XP_004349004.2 hypothetical protein CAOG_02254 [Capsaspora owczarzaki ATCC 30864]